MRNKNLVQETLPAELYEEITETLKAIQQKLLPYTATLRHKDVKKLKTINSKSYPFVQKAITASQVAPHLKPAWVSSEEMEKDFLLYKQMQQLTSLMEQISDLTRSTAYIAGDEAMSASLAIYNLAKSAAAMGIEGANQLYTDMKKRFPQRTRRRLAKTEGEEASQNSEDLPTDFSQ
jgi:hypothetical protein